MIAVTRDQYLALAEIVTDLDTFVRPIVIGEGIINQAMEHMFLKIHEVPKNYWVYVPYKGSLIRING